MGPVRLLRSSGPLIPQDPALPKTRYEECAGKRPRTQALPLALASSIPTPYTDCILIQAISDVEGCMCN